MAIIVIAAWPYGSVHESSQYLIACGVAALTAMWAAHAVLTRSISLRPDPVSIALAGIAVFTVIQLIPLPESIVGIISPKRLEWHQTFLPAVMESIEPNQKDVPRPKKLTLTICPSETREFLARVLMILAVYAAARNWLGTPGSLVRMGWVLTFAGLVLAVFALGQFFSSPQDTIFWSQQIPNAQVYGPFVCRNHYPDYLAFCLGLAGGMMLAGRRDEQNPYESSMAGEDGPSFFDRLIGAIRLLTDPRVIGFGAAAGLMFISIPFSMSRGGTLAALAAGFAAILFAKWAKSSEEKSSGAGFAITIALMIALGLGAWFGWDAVETRFSTLFSEKGLDSRSELWGDAIRAVPGQWLTGSGAGTFRWAEVSVRQSSEARLIYENAHNEYLEALVEGGVFRLGFTLLLAVGPLIVIGRGYLKHRNGSSGTLLLGVWFGVAMLALHSGADFAVHIPAVSLIAAAVTGIGMAVSAEPAKKAHTQRGVPNAPKQKKKVKVRRRVRMKSSQSKEYHIPSSGEISAGGSGPVRLPAEDGGPVPVSAPAAASYRTPPPERTPAPRTASSEDSSSSSSGSSSSSSESSRRISWTVDGPMAVGLGVFITAVMIVVAMDTRNRARAERMMQASNILANQEVPLEERAKYLSARVSARRDDPDALVDLAMIRFAQAEELADNTGATIAGPAAYAISLDVYPDAIHKQFGIPGLRAAMSARSACPIHPKPHFVLGNHADAFVKSEPAIAHLERAKKLLEVDSYIWFRTGRDAYDRGDFPTAWENWKGALRRSPQYLATILRLASQKLSPVELRDQVLPDNPTVLMAAASNLFPNAAEQSAERLPFVEKAAGLVDREGLSPMALVSVGAALDEIGKYEESGVAYKRAAEQVKGPQAFDVRLNYARWLEREEHYPDAVKELTWLSQQKPGDGRLRDRLISAQHGEKLAKILGQK